MMRSHVYRNTLASMKDKIRSKTAWGNVHISTVVIFLKATKGKSQNRISLKRQRFLKIDKSESFLDFYLVYNKYVYLKVMR